MNDELALSVGSARLGLIPELGGGVSKLCVNGRHVLRPFTGEAENPFSLGLTIMVPFCNRIGDGRFFWNGKEFRVAANWPPQVLPIHGDGFQRAWRVATCHDDAASLELDDGRIGPWNYRAQLHYLLREDELSISLELVNTGNDVLPFGGGFHPAFPRDGDTRIQFAAGGLWLAGRDDLPRHKAPSPIHPRHDFTRMRDVPPGRVNHTYADWSRRARIEQGQAWSSCTITASDRLSALHLFVPDGAVDTVCLEPVSHPVNALNLVGLPGLWPLRPGEVLELSMTLAWTAPDIPDSP